MKDAKKLDDAALVMWSLGYLLMQAPDYSSPNDYNKGLVALELERRAVKRAEGSSDSEDRVLELKRAAGSREGA